MPGFIKGRYAVRRAASEVDVQRAQSLRFLAFVAAPAGAGGPYAADPCMMGRDHDDFDTICQHILIEEVKTGTLVCCFRLLPLTNGAEVAQSYSAQFYDLAALASFQGPMAEMGRFCIHPDWHDPDILRVAWGAMTRFVDATGVEMLFGCSSFQGIDAARYHDAFAMLKDSHLAPERWLPREKAAEVIRYAQDLRPQRPDHRAAMLTLPPLLRSYLLMGGWVSDHAVVDRALNTLHVFTGLEIRAIPPARARLLREAAR